MANLFLNLIYSLTAGLSSVVSRMQNFLGALSMEGIGVSGGNFVTGAKNFMNLVFWEIEKFILGILSVLEYIAYEFLGIGQGVDNYANFATKNNLTSTYTRTFKAVAVVAIILMIVFTIFAIIRQEWVAFQAKGGLSPKNNDKIPIIMRLFRGIMTIIALPVTVVIIFGAVNSVLSSFNRALQGRDESTIATNVLATASYNSNRFRLYVEQDKRVPIIIQAYDPSDYKADELDELKYKIRSVDVQNKLKSTAMDLAKNTFVSFKESLTFSNNKITNSSKYGDFYESFVCTPEQYQVLADFVDYAELTQTNFYIKAVDDDTVDWKYVSATVYNESEKSLTITYQDASKLTKNNNGLNTTSAASASNTQNAETYTITYSLGYDISSPISDAYKTMQALLGIGDYSDILYNKMEREDGSVNVVHWASKKVSIHFSKNFVRDNPQTWTPTDEILMYEYYHFAVNNTFQDYSLEDLSYQKAVEENDPVTLDAKIYTYRKYYAYADAYSPEIDVDCVFINGNYYITELSTTESDKFGNPYYVLKNIEDTNFLTHTYTTAYIAEGKNANIKFSAFFDLNDPMTWTYSDQIIMYEYYKDLSYNNEWSKYRISDFGYNSGNKVQLPVYVITLHSNLEDIEGSSQFYTLINGVYYELKKDSGEDNNFSLFSPKTYYKIRNVSTEEERTVEFNSITKDESGDIKLAGDDATYKLVGVNYEQSSQFLKEIDASGNAKTFYNYTIQLDSSYYDNYGISTEEVGKTAENFIIVATTTKQEGAEDITTYEGGLANYYSLTDSKQTESPITKNVKLVDKNGLEIKDEHGNPVYEDNERTFIVITEKALIQEDVLAESLEFDNFEKYGDFELKFSNTFDYKDVNTWSYRDYFIFYIYSKYLSISGVTLNQLRTSGGLRGEVCRAGISVNTAYSDKIVTGSDIKSSKNANTFDTFFETNSTITNIYDYDDYGNQIITDKNGKKITDNDYQPIISDYIYLFRIDNLLTSNGSINKTVYLKIEDVLNISQMNILNPLNTNLTFNNNNFDRAYESNLFIEIDTDSENEINFSYAETSNRPFSFSTSVIYDSQSTWTVGDFILFYLAEQGVISVSGVSGSFVDQEDIIRAYTYNALSYVGNDNKNYYKFGSSSSSLYLNESYIKSTLRYSTIDEFWNAKLFDFISRLGNNSNSASSSVILNNQTIADNLYMSYTSNVYNKDNLISELVNKYIVSIDSSVQVNKSVITYSYYNPDFSTNNIATWTVLDGIIYYFTGNVSRSRYEFQTAYKYDSSGTKEEILCLLIDDEHAIELKDVNISSLGLELTQNFEIKAKTSSEEIINSNFSKTFGLVNSSNIVSFKNMSTLSKKSISKFKYTFVASSSTNLSKLDCLLIELYNTKNASNEYMYRGLSLVSNATLAKKGQTFDYDIYVQTNGSSNNYYLYLGNMNDEAYFYVFDISRASSFISSISEYYNIACNKYLFTDTETEYTYVENIDLETDDIKTSDKLTLLDAIIYKYKTILGNDTYKIYRTETSSSFVNVNGNIINTSTLTTEYSLSTLTSISGENIDLIKSIYNNYYKDYYLVNSGINSGYSSTDVIIFEEYTDGEGVSHYKEKYTDDEHNEYKNEVTTFRLNDLKTWTPLNVVLYNLGIISDVGSDLNELTIYSSTIFSKGFEQYLRISTSSGNFDFNLNGLATNMTLQINEKSVVAFKYNKSSTIEIFLRAIYLKNMANESNWNNFQNAIGSYANSVKTTTSLNLVQTFSPKMKFEDISTWNWYEMLYYYYNGSLPSGSISYLTYGKYESTEGYVEISIRGGYSLYVKIKPSDSMDIFNNIGTMFNTCTEDELQTLYPFASSSPSSIDLFFINKETVGGKTNVYYNFGYNLQEDQASIFGIINYKLSGGIAGRAQAYKFYLGNEVIYYLNSASETYIRNLTDEKIEVDSINNVKYTGKAIHNKTTSELTVFDLYVKSIAGNVTSDSNTVIKFGDSYYLLINEQYLNLSLLNISLEESDGSYSLEFLTNTTIINQIGIDDGSHNKLFLNSSSTPAGMHEVSSTLPTLPGMVSGSTIINLHFSTGFDFSNFSTWKLSDFILYYIFIENNFNYNNNREDEVTNFQEFVTKGYVESTFCNMQVTDENGNTDNYNVLLIGQAIETNEFNSKLNFALDDVSKYILVDYSIFYELFAKNLMNISTYSFSSAPLSIESIGSVARNENATIKKFGISFSSDINVQDFIYNNNVYFEINNDMIDEYFASIGISEDTTITTRSASSVLINLQLSLGFNINDPSTWTVLDYIIVYEYSRNVSNNAFEGLTFDDLKTGFLYELEKEETSGAAKVVLNINGDRYNLSHWYTDNIATTLEITDNLYTSIAKSINVLKFNVTGYDRTRVETINWTSELLGKSELENDINKESFNVRFSSQFNENDISSWTIFDWVIYYELNNSSIFQDNGKSFETLTTEDWVYPIIKVPVDSGEKVKDQYGRDTDEPIYHYRFEIRFGSHTYNMNKILVYYGSNEYLTSVDVRFNVLSKVDVATSNTGYDMKVLSETRRFNIQVDTRDVVSELENTLVSGTGASATYYLLRNLDTDEEIYVNSNDYSEEIYSTDNFEVLDDNFVINDTISRTTFTDNFGNTTDENGSSHKRIELIKMSNTLLYSAKNNSVDWSVGPTKPKILNNYYKFINTANGEIVYVHRDNVGSGKLYTAQSGGTYKKNGADGIVFRLYDANSTPSGTTVNTKNNVEFTYYRNLDKNVYFNYQLSLTRYSNYVISPNIQKVNWPQKLINDLMVIYPDIENESGINWSTLLATDGWIKALGDYHSGLASGNYLVSGDSANINAIGLVLSEFLLSIATEPTGYARYANYEYTSIYDSSTIKALMLSILGEEEYDALVNEANIFVDFFNVGFAGVLDDIARERDIKIKEGKVDGLEMSIYKSYLSTAILSSDFAEYLYTVATRVLAQYTIYESLARSADDYDTYYAYYNKQTDSNGDLVNAFTYGTFKQLVEYENRSLKDGKVPMFTFNLKYVGQKYKESKEKNNSSFFGRIFNGISDFVGYIFGRSEEWGKMLAWYEEEYRKKYLQQNDSFSQEDPMYCFMFDVYYSIKQSIQRSGVNEEPIYLQLYKAYIDGDKNENLSGVLRRWNIIKDVSIDGSSVFYPNYTKYQLMMQLYKAKAMASYLDFILMPLYTPMDAIKDAAETFADAAAAEAAIVKDVVELGVDLAVDTVGMAADVEAMKWDVLFNQDDIGDRAGDIGDRAVNMYNNVKDTATDIYDTVAELYEKMGNRSLDALSAILSVNGAVTCGRVFSKNEIYSGYLNYILNPNNSFIYPYLKSEGKLYDLDLRDIPLVGSVIYPAGITGVDIGWENINTLYNNLGLLMEAFETLYDVSEQESNGYVYRYWGLRENVIAEVFDKLSEWHNNVGTYINLQSMLDRAAKGSITFTLAQYTNNYKEEGYNFTIQNRTYKMKTAVSAQRIGEYVYGGEFLEHFGIPATYTSSTFTGAINIGSGFDYETNEARKTISSFDVLKEFASGLANYTGKLYLLSNVMDLSATNNDNPIDPSINSTDSIKMTDYIYAVNPLTGKLYSASGSNYIRTTQEYLIIDYIIQNNYLSYDTLRSLLLIDDETTIPDTIKAVTNEINFSTLTSEQQKNALDYLRFYLAYVQSDSYNVNGNYNINENTTGKDRIHTIFKKTILYLTNKVEDNSNGYETQYEGDTLSFEDMYFQKLRLTLINSLVNFEKNETDTGEANSNRYLTLYHLSNSEFDYYYNSNAGEKYATIGLIAENDSKEVLIGRNMLLINNSIIVNGENSETSAVEYIDEFGTQYSARASFRVDSTSDGLFKKLAGIEHRPVEELVNRQYNNLYSRNGCYDEELGDIFVVCTYDPVNGIYLPILAEGKGYNRYTEIAKEFYGDDGRQSNAYNRSIETDYCEGPYAFPIIAKGVIIDGITGYMPTAIKMVNNEVSFYRDSVTATGDVNDAVASGVVITEMSTSKYIKYVGSSSFSGYGDSYTMYIGANNPVAYIESNANVYYIQYTTDYSIETEDEFGAISVLAQFPNFYTFDMVFHLLMLLGFVVMIPVVFKAILLGMRRMLDLMALILVAPLAIATNSLQLDDKTNKIYDEWKRMFTASLLTVFGIVVSFNIYYILVNTALHMTFITAGDATMTIIADSPLSFITASFLNNVIKFFFVIIAANLVESGGNLIGRIITGRRVKSSFASQTSDTEPLEDMMKIKGDLTKAARIAGKLYTGELLQEAKEAALEMAKESVPGSALIRKAIENSRGKKDAKTAQGLAKAAKDSGVDSVEAKRLAANYLEKAQEIRKLKRDNKLKLANAFVADTDIGLPIGLKEGDLDVAKKDAKRVQKLKLETKQEEAEQKKQEKDAKKKFRKAQKLDELHAKGKKSREEKKADRKAARQQKRKESIDRLDRDIRENGISGGVKKWVKDGATSWVNKQKARVHKVKDSVKNGAKKAWGTLKSLPGKAWNGIKTGFRKAKTGIVIGAHKTWGAMKKAGGALKTGAVKGIKAIGRGAVAVKNGIGKAAVATWGGVKKAAGFLKDLATNPEKRKKFMNMIKKGASTLGNGIVNGVKKGAVAVAHGAQAAAVATAHGIQTAYRKTKSFVKDIPNKMRRAKEATVKLAKKTYKSMVRVKNKAKQKIKTGIQKGINKAKKGIKKMGQKAKQAALNTMFGKIYTGVRKGVDKTRYGVSRIKKVGYIIKDSHDMQKRAAERYAQLQRQRQQN